MIRHLLLLAILAFGLGCAIAAQETSTTTTTTTVIGTTVTTVVGTTGTTIPGSTTTTIHTIAYTPYTPEEFPDWANKLRRAEIIAVGAFPLAFLFSGLSYDIGRYVDLYSRNSPDASLYAPFIFAPSNKPAYTVDENVGLIVSSIFVSLAVALADFIIGEVQEGIAREKAAANNTFILPPTSP